MGTTAQYAPVVYAVSAPLLASGRWRGGHLRMVAHILSLHQGPLPISRQSKRERTGEGREGNKREAGMKAQLSLPTYTT